MMGCRTAAAADLTNLRCEYLANPLGIDVPKPRLSWVIESTRRGEEQTAYQVLVASTPEKLAQNHGDLWDTGQVASDQSIQVEYSGKPLHSETQCHWKVRVWLARRSLGEGRDTNGKASAWSPPALWTMGLLDPRDWQAAWIKPIPAAQEVAKSGGAPGVQLTSEGNSPAPWVRKVFTLAGTPEQAVAYVNVMGYYELYVNGQKVGSSEKFVLGMVKG